MNGIFRVGFFVAGRPLSRVEGLSTRARKAAGGKRKKGVSPPDPLRSPEWAERRLHWGRLWLQRIPLRIELQPQWLEGTVAYR